MFTKVLCHICGRHLQPVYFISKCGTQTTPIFCICCSMEVVLPRSFLINVSYVDLSSAPLSWELILSWHTRCHGFILSACKKMGAGIRVQHMIQYSNNDGSRGGNMHHLCQIMNSIEEAEGYTYGKNGGDQTKALSCRQRLLNSTSELGQADVGPRCKGYRKLPQAAQDLKTNIKLWGYRRNKIW